MNNMFQSQYQLNDAFNNNESKELDKLARKINDKHAQSNNTYQQKFSGMVCDQLDCMPYSQQIANNTQSFFSAQGNYSSVLPSTLSPRYSITDDNDSISDETKVFSESDSFRSLPSLIDDNSLSSTYSSLPVKIKKHLKMNSPHMKKNKMTNSDTDDIAHLKSCNDCKQKFIQLLQNNGNLQQTPNNKSNNFINFTNPDLKDVIVLILIGVIIIMSIDIIVRQ